MPASQRRMFLAPRSTTGCLTCRRRHKKCDEVHPRCAGCTRNHLLCRWPDDLTRVSESSEAKTASSSHLVSIRQPSMLPPLFRSEPNSFLLQHFAEVTSVQLASRVVPENAYLTYNLRLAWEGDGIQHAILAISLSHVSYIQSWSTGSYLGHYLVALRWVKHAITRWASSSPVVRCLIVATSLALCQYEVLNANREGSLYHHLRGLKFMISQLDHDKRVHDQDLLGFFAEQYHYLTIVSHLGFDLTLAPLDWKPADRVAIHSLTTLNEGRPIYGFMFGRAHSLFALIPSVHSLAVQCWHETRPARVELEVMYLTLLLQITCWEGDDDTSHPAYRIAGQMYQQALLIFLHVGFSGPEALSMHMFCQIDGCVEAFLTHSEELPPDALTRTTTMWPYLVSESCMLREDQRRRLLAMLDDPAVKFPVLKCMRDSLVLFWRELDQDSGLYGPHGLERTLKKHRIVLCIG